MRRKDREVTRHGDLMEMVARFKVCRLGLWDDMRALGLCDAYLVLIIPVNIWLDTNYGFTRYAPAGTVLEYFGSAPWYLLTLQIPALVLLRLLYLTVRVRKK